jgi:hypothetical protein
MRVDFNRGVRQLSDREKLFCAALLAIVVGATVFAVLFAFSCALFYLAGSPALVPVSLLFLLLMLTGISGLQVFARVLSTGPHRQSAKKVTDVFQRDRG